jgi:aspartyl-tRNA(Asn)/glutamyl-tRNA(Gln) amidotransferase subunit B
MPEDTERVDPKMLVNWIIGELFGLLNQANYSINEGPVTAKQITDLVVLVGRGVVNQNTAKNVLSEMFATGKPAMEIIAAHGWQQISDSTLIAELVQKVLAENPGQVADYLAGKQKVGSWLFGEAMRAAKGQANPQVLKQELEKQIRALE